MGRASSPPWTTRVLSLRKQSSFFAPGRVAFRETDPVSGRKKQYISVRSAFPFFDSERIGQLFEEAT